MFEQAFKNIDDVLWKEAGCTTELDYTEQTSWLLFLKYLDGLEQDKADEAALDGKKYSFILDKPYRWESWAAPKGKDGQIDHNKAQTGDDLRDFVNGKLFPYLHGFKQKASGPNTIEYKIGEIFGEIKNKIQSGYNLREIIDHIDELQFRSQKEKHAIATVRREDQADGKRRPQRRRVLHAPPVDPGHDPGGQAPQPLLEQWHQARLKHDVILLSNEQREIVQLEIRNHCEFRQWRLWIANPRTNHVHVVVTARGYAGSKVRDQLKANCTRGLRQQDPRFVDRPVWTVGGDWQCLNSEEDLEQAILYAGEAQDRMEYK